MRLNVNGHLLPIRLKSEPETIHVHAHGLTLVSFADLRVISTEQTRAPERARKRSRTRIRAPARFKLSRVHHPKKLALVPSNRPNIVPNLSSCYVPASSNRLYAQVAQSVEQ